MHGIEGINVLRHPELSYFMAKAPRLGHLHRYFPRWWHQAEPTTVALENFQRKPEPSPYEQNKSRFEKLAEIVLRETPGRKGPKKAA
jgi:hypothetical protein